MRGRWIALLAWMVVVLFNSSIPSAGLPTSSFVSLLINKAGHVIEYAILGLLLWRCVAEPAGGLDIPSRFSLLAVAVVGACFAGLDELRQAFVSGRGPGSLDALLDAVSVLVVAGLLARAAPRADPQALERGDEGLGGEDGDEQVHREDLPVAVDVR